VPRFAILSSRVYEKLGDDVTNELVDLYNMLNAELDAERRRAARAEAMLEIRIAQLRAEICNGWRFLDIGHRRAYS